MAGPLESPSVTKAVSKLEDTFRSTETELKQVEIRLEAEYRAMFDDTSAFSDKVRNPVNVMNRLCEVKSDYVKIKQDVLEIQKLQKEALTQVKAEFDKMLLSLSSLESKVLPDSVDNERYCDKEQQLSSLIGHMAEKSGKITTTSKYAGTEGSSEQSKPPSTS